MKYFEDKLIGIAAWRLLRIAEGKEHEDDHEELLQAIEELFKDDIEMNTRESFLRALKSEFDEGHYPQIEQFIEDGGFDAIFGHLFEDKVNRKLLLVFPSYPYGL